MTDAAPAEAASAEPGPADPAPTDPEPVPGETTAGGVRAAAPVVVLVNPVSGRRDGRRIARWIAARWPETRVAVVCAEDFAQRRARMLALAEAGAREVLVQGGDGSLGTAVSLLHESGFFAAGGALGLIPSGSGNDFARGRGLVRKPGPAEVEALVGAALRFADTGRGAAEVDAIAVRCGRRERLAANSLNIGFDAEVSLRADALERVPAGLKYLVGLLGAIPAFRSFAAGLRLDGGTARRRRRTLVTVLNGPFVGGGIRLGPGASAEDGILDLVEVRPLSRGSLGLFFPTAYLGLHVHHPAVRVVRAEAVELELPAGVPVCADGEELHDGGAPVPVEARVAKESWRLLAASGRL